MAAKEAAGWIAVVTMDEYCDNRIEVVTHCMEADETYYSVADIHSIKWFLTKDGFHSIPEDELDEYYPTHKDSANTFRGVERSVNSTTPNG